MQKDTWPGLCLKWTCSRRKIAFSKLACFSVHLHYRTQARVDNQLRLISFRKSYTQFDKGYYFILVIWKKEHLKLINALFEIGGSFCDVSLYVFSQCLVVGGRKQHIVPVIWFFCMFGGGFTRAETHLEFLMQKMIHFFSSQHSLK